MENTEVEALFQYAAEGILIVDHLGKINRINPCAERLFGYEKDELIGQPIEVLIPGRFTERHKRHSTGYINAPRARIMGSGLDLKGLKKDGTEFPVEISLSPYSTENGRYVFAFIADITIRKKAEENLKNYSIELEQQVQSRTAGLQKAVKELKKTKEELKRSLDKERDLNELKSRFVSMASHEFRTPLTTILSSLYLIDAKGELNEPQRKYVDKIKRSIDNLTEILQDFLSVSKLEEGQLPFQPEPVNLEQYLSVIAQEMEEFAVNEQQIVYRHSGEMLVHIDQKLLKNTLFNLISNALKFSPPGKEVRIESIVNDSEIRISVRDEGIGISENDQKHLFERFFRGTNAVYIQGTGLGLHLVKKYVELMQGRIVVESIQNQGTCFTIVLPQKYVLP